MLTSTLTFIISLSWTLTSDPDMDSDFDLNHDLDPDLKVNLAAARSASAQFILEVRVNVCVCLFVWYAVGHCGTELMRLNNPTTTTSARRLVCDQNDITGLGIYGGGGVRKNKATHLSI